MAKAQSPFLIVNPKSYLYGKESLELAKAADQDVYKRQNRWISIRVYHKSED